LICLFLYKINILRIFKLLLTTTINVYEGWNGKGALIAVLHGEYTSKTVTVKGSGALVVFKSDQQVTKKGFEAKYVISAPTI
jgi:hypothetical protein